MTVESEVANLTTAVDNLTSAVNVKKATLDEDFLNLSKNTVKSHALPIAVSSLTRLLCISISSECSVVSRPSPDLVDNSSSTIIF